ncbi:minor capsid protein [Streptomyces neyagawaensis]|uniref:minor capsid protein n=1 Tax=Streptomyces neyagawaensis TaxID=42238 RepID=UPI0006E1BD30|nr:minor capsid protein [Streptomyces neyagawaensis]MCL6734375.1 minor capsid protein [Streptomyces neyagawaensis]MDE1682004.1 minor capsid protein [Streptomyces neyagawaensis]
MSTHDVDLLQGVAELLDAEDVGTYDPSGVLPAGSTGIVLGKVPDGPDRAIGLTPYPVSDDDSTDAVTGIQARMRAGTDPLAVVQLANDVFTVLHNRRSYDAHGVQVEISWRNSQAWIGQDTHGRMELVANYYFRTIRSGPHLID